eukprot:TRINITY_DN7470_c0_g1_i1.p1 TRINITY_DN7470_c0_g1~~TRINITY_DN7470_c0_g1_i1.p1  ORF type:complete len:145 (+),score=28.38 TRINITY_DN7470_c0_g1_i1:20-454(+)
MAHLTFAPEIETEKLKLLQVSNKLGWLLCGYEGKTHICLQAKGDGDVDEFVPLLKDDQVQFVLIRLPKGKLLGDCTDTASLDVFMTWTGPAVRRIERGQKKGDVPGVSQHLQPHHVDIEAINKNNISADSVRHRSFGAGSHVID